MRTFQKSMAVALVAATLSMSTMLPTAVRASESGRKNTTLGLGALTGILAAKGKWIPAAVGAAGTYYAYKNWQAEINKRHRDQSRAAYRQQYRPNANNTNQYNGPYRSNSSSQYNGPYSNDGSNQSYHSSSTYNSNNGYQSYANSGSHRYSAVNRNGSPGPTRQFAHDYLGGRTTPVRVVVNDEPVNFAGQQALVSHGHTLVPLRGVFEALGAHVNWDPATQTVTAERNGRTVKLPMGSRYAMVDGQSVLMDYAPDLFHGRVMVPLRFVSEALGANVNWNSNTSTVRIHEA